MPSKATGTTKRVPVEQFTKGLYKEKAKMNAFKIKPNNVASWIKVMAVRYYSQMGEIEEIDCSWRDILDNDEAEEFVSEVRIQLIDKSNDLEDKLFTITMYLNIQTVTIQGNFYQEWCEKEFPLLKVLVEELKEGASIETGENNECESEDEISFDGDATVLAINSDNSDIETSDMGETSPKLLLDTDDTTVTEYNNSKASENKQKTDCHTNETTSLSGATKHHATSKETIQLNKNSARTSETHHNLLELTLVFSALDLSQLLI